MTTDLQTTHSPVHTPTWTTEEMTLIKETYSTGLTDIQFRLFLAVAKRIKLNPINKEIYPLPFREKRNSDEPPKLIIHVSIDGYRKRSAQMPGYIGPDNERFLIEDKDGTTRIVPMEEYSPKMGTPVSATVDILWDNPRRRVKGTALWKDYNNPNNPIWQRMGTHMLMKCAEALAHRKGLPAEFAGTYAPEEMIQALGPGQAATTTQRKLPPPPQQTTKDRQTNDAQPAENFPDLVPPPKQNGNNKPKYQDTIAVWIAAQEFIEDSMGEAATQIATTIRDQTYEDFTQIDSPELIEEFANWCRTTLIAKIKKQLKAT